MKTIAQLQGHARDLLRAHSSFAAATILLASVPLLAAVASIARASNVATLVTSEPHGLLSECHAAIAGVTDTTFNAEEAEITVINATTFTFPNVGANVSTTPDATGVVRGEENEVAEAALRTGLCVTVLPPLDANFRDKAAGKTILDVGLALRLAVNPRPTNLNIFTLINDAVMAVSKPTRNSDNGFTLADAALRIDDAERGALAYHLFFQALALLA